LGTGFEIRRNASDNDSTFNRFVRVRPQTTIRNSEKPHINPDRVGSWPRFRGPEGAGLADGLSVPLQFDVSNKDQIAWKTAIPGVGHSSPVIWGNRVFVTTAVPLNDDPTYELSTRSGFDTHNELIEYRWLALCIDLNTGETLWTTQLSKGKPVAQRHVMSSHANCTPAVNSEVVVVNLAGQGVFCLSHAGETLWKKDLGRLAAGWFMDSGYEWGFASSPVIQDDRVFIQCDVFEGSFMTALSLEDGGEVWRVARSERSSWGTPLVVKDADVTQLIANGTNAICSYDADNGDELWRIDGNSEVTVASPIACGNNVLVMGGYQPIQPIFAINVGSRGNLTESEEGIRWQTEKGGAYCITPIVYGELLFILQSNGVITCRQVSDGSVLYKKRVGGGRSGDLVASPIAADGHLFIPTTKGDVFVLPASPEYTPPKTCPLGEPIMASPAAAEGCLILRGVDHLYCITGATP
ncbi:MAG: PQQ-binding-like beta-propeller repeat protein, partial [Planctomycetota bacterium]